MGASDSVEKPSFSFPFLRVFRSKKSSILQPLPGAHLAQASPFFTSFHWTPSNSMGFRDTQYIS